ncbi:hypothetical protein WJX73_006216 [Symbiochloris irregularis]|uniref:PX domain-containing protein n=1 Tax=Symbiochloris irregularis TaxID=706552 RepID=A0AAW1PA17_9CHLO
MEGEHVLELLKEAVTDCTRAQEDAGIVPFTSSGLLLSAVESFLTAGLIGNRAVTADPWLVVTSIERAFPLQLAPAVEAAKAQAEPEQTRSLLQLWIIQAAADGSLATLISKVCTAYARTSAIRNRELTSGFQAAVEPLKGCVFQHVLELEAPADVTHQPASDVNAGEQRLVASELGDQIYGVAQGLLEMGMALDQPVTENPLLVLLLKLVQSLLVHGQLPRARATQQGWTSMLPHRVASAFDVLLAVEAVQGSMMGVKELQHQAGQSSAAVKVAMWLRKSLNEQALGARMLALCSAVNVLDVWFEGWAAVRQEAVMGKVLGMLASLDGIKFVLVVDAPTVEASQLGPMAMPQRAGQLLASFGRAIASAPSNLPQVLNSGAFSAAINSSQVAFRHASQSLNPGARAPPTLPAILTSGTWDALQGTGSGSVLTPLSTADGCAQPLSPATLAFLHSLGPLPGEGSQSSIGLSPLGQDLQADADALEILSGQEAAGNVDQDWPALQLPQPGSSLPDFEAGDSHADFLDQLLNPRPPESTVDAGRPPQSGPPSDITDEGRGPLAAPEVPGSRSADLDELLLQDMHDVLHESPDLEHSGLHYRRRPASSGPGRQALSVTVTGDNVQQNGAAGNTYTEYVLEVVGADGQAWEVAHRFRDFIALRSLLKEVEGVKLPESWLNLSRARSVTGQSRLTPEVVAARRGMLQHCLRDILAAPTALSCHPALLHFLGAPLPNSSPLQRDPGHAETLPETMPFSGGGRVRLITARPVRRSDEELLELQGGLCAGCQGELALEGPTSRWGFRSKPSNKGIKRCHFHSLLYCPDCHRGETAEVPACVLHEWDFTRYPVSNLALDFLESIYDQPLLCISAVNPGLFARIPLLARTRELRQRACKALAAASAAGPSAMAQVDALLAKAGSRRYMLDAAEFWAMRELVELSKGAFSSLPGWLSAILQRASDLTTSCLLAHNV